MAEFLMPSLGPDMDEGAIVEWRIRPGDEVHRGDVVAVVQTDKADIDVEVFRDGTVEELLVAPGVKVAVGTPLARLSGAEPSPTRPTASVPAPLAAAAPPVGAAVPLATPTLPATVTTIRPRSLPPSRSGIWSPLVRHLAEVNGVDPHAVTGTGPGGSIRRRDVERAIRKAHARPRRISPRARHLAEAQGVDLRQVTGTGPGGAVTGDDVLATAAASAPAVDRRELQRRAVGALMARSKREIPHYYLSVDVELGSVLEQLRLGNEQRPPDRRVLPAALFLHAVAHAAAEIRGFNGHWSEQTGYVPADRVDLGVAVALRTGGLVAPTIRDAGSANLDDLNTALRDLVARARSGHLAAADTADATLTVTNLGDRGASLVYGAIVPPQVAIVGFGRVAPRPWVVEDAVLPRPVVTVTLSADHRVTSGHEGSQFLDALATVLHPTEELEP